MRARVVAQIFYKTQSLTKHKPGAAVVMGLTVALAVSFGQKKIISSSNTNEGRAAVVGGVGGEYVSSLMSNLRCPLPDKISTL